MAPLGAKFWIKPYFPSNREKSTRRHWWLLPGSQVMWVSGGEVLLRAPWPHVILTVFALTTRLGHGWGRGAIWGTRPGAILPLIWLLFLVDMGPAWISWRSFHFSLLFLQSMASENHELMGKKAEALPRFPQLGGKATGQEDECGPATRREESDFFFLRALN